MSYLKHHFRDRIISWFSDIGSFFPARPVILMCHSVNTNWDRMGLEFETFKKVILSFKESGFYFLKMDDLQSLDSVPKKSVLLTFDDGLKDNYTYAVPLLRQLQIPAVFFIPTNFIGKPFVRAQFESMDIQAIKEIANDPLFEIGSHAQTHRRFTKITEAEARYELIESKYILEKILGKQIRSFAFPYGSHTRHHHIQLAKEAGYDFIFTTIQRRLSQKWTVETGFPRFIVNVYTAPFLLHIVNPGFELYWRIYEKTYQPVCRFINKVLLKNNS